MCCWHPSLACVVWVQKSENRFCFLRRVVVVWVQKSENTFCFLRRVVQKGRNPKWRDDGGEGRVLGLGFQFSVVPLR